MDKTSRSPLFNGIHADNSVISWLDDLSGQYAFGIGSHACGKRSAENSTAIRIGFKCQGKHGKCHARNNNGCEPVENRFESSEMRWIF